MNRCFWQSKVAMVVVQIITLVLAVLVWIRNAGRPVYFSVIAVILLLVIGYTSSILVGNFISSQCNHKLMGILHIDMLPERFVEVYRHIPDHIDKKNANYSVTRSYLADGYCAMGQWDEAIGMLNEDFTDKKGQENISLKCLYYNNLCNYLLQKGDGAGGKNALKQLREVLKQAKVSKPALAANLQENVKLYQNWLRYYENHEVETKQLETMLFQSQFKIRRVEIAYLLALTYLRDNRKKEAREKLEFLVKEGGELYQKKEAEKAWKKMEA